MLTQNQINNLNITGKNTLHDNSNKNLVDNFHNNIPSNEVANFILNSNLENENSIR